MLMIPAVSSFPSCSISEIIWNTKVCANTLCRYCKIAPVNDRKKSFEQISLVYVSRIQSRFFDRSTLEKVEVLHREKGEEKFMF